MDAVVKKVDGEEGDIRYNFYQEFAQIRRGIKLLSRLGDFPSDPEYL